MKNKKLESKLSAEIISFLSARKTLNLATLDQDGHPYASYAPFAHLDDHLYVLLSDIAIHGTNLRGDSRAAIQIVEDESEAATIFARVRVNYQVQAEHIPHQSGEEFELGIKALADKHGDRIQNLASLSDFNLFKLKPIHGRFVRDFGRAYALTGGTLSGESIDHLRDGHKPRSVA